MSIRKNFLFDDEIVSHLEAIAKREKTTQTNVIRNLIKEKYQAISIEEKLEAFRAIVPMPPGSLVGKSIQSIKAEMATKI